MQQYADATVNAPHDVIQSVSHAKNSIVGGAEKVRSGEVGAGLKQMADVTGFVTSAENVGEGAAEMMHGDLAEGSEKFFGGVAGVAGNVLLFSGAAAKVKTKAKPGVKSAKEMVSNESGAVKLQNKTATSNTTGYRYMTQGEIDAINTSGMLRGGNPGETFFTKDIYKSATKAQNRLSLPSKPTHRVEFEILNKLKMSRYGTKVKSDFGMEGKGTEFSTMEQVKVRIINSQSLGK